MKQIASIVGIVVAAVVLLSACGPTPSPQVVELETELPVEVTTVVEVAVEKVVTATPEPAEPLPEGS